MSRRLGGRHDRLVSLLAMNRRYRLTRSSEFQRVRGEGRSWAHPLVVLSACPGQKGQTRVGFAVGKWVGKATTRNRVKRRLREAIRRRMDRLQSGWDVVVIARSPIVGTEFKQIDSAIESLLRRARLFVDLNQDPVWLVNE